MNNIPNKLSRQYGVDKLAGELSNEYLAKHPNLIQDAIVTRKILCGYNEELYKNINYQWWYLDNPLFEYIYMYISE
jgi:hypothetical protein